MKIDRVAKRVQCHGVHIACECVALLLDQYEHRHAIAEEQAEFWRKKSLGKGDGSKTAIYLSIIGFLFGMLCCAGYFMLKMIWP